jgi:hypothetical protein
MDYNGHLADWQYTTKVLTISTGVLLFSILFFTLCVVVMDSIISDFYGFGKRAGNA